MLKIADMPRGGGADRGRRVWFAFTVEGGAEQVFELDQAQMEPLIAGLRHFAEEARALRKVNGEPEAPAPAPLAEKVRSRVTAAGDLEVSVGLKRKDVLNFVVPRAGVKAMLRELAAAFNRSTQASQPAQAERAPSSA